MNPDNKTMIVTVLMTIFLIIGLLITPKISVLMENESIKLPENCSIIQNMGVLDSLLSPPSLQGLCGGRISSVFCCSIAKVNCRVCNALESVIILMFSFLLTAFLLVYFLKRYMKFSIFLLYICGMLIGVSLGLSWEPNLILSPASYFSIFYVGMCVATWIFVNFDDSYKSNNIKKFEFWKKRFKIRIVLEKRSNKRIIGTPFWVLPQNKNKFK